VLIERDFLTVVVHEREADHPRDGTPAPE
jgi:hypothetical protein